MNCQYMYFLPYRNISILEPKGIKLYKIIRGNLVPRWEICELCWAFSPPACPQRLQHRESKRQELGWGWTHFHPQYKTTLYIKLDSQGRLLLYFYRVCNLFYNYINYHFTMVFRKIRLHGIQLYRKIVYITTFCICIQ